MITKELLSYIEAQTTQGIEKDLIKKTLLEAGWREADINEAFESIIVPMQASPREIIPVHIEGVKVMPTVSGSNSHGLLKTFFVTLLALAALSFSGAFVYVSYFKDPSPQEVFKEMMTALTEVDIFEYNFDLKANGSVCMGFDDQEDVFGTCNDKKDFTNTTLISGIANIENFSNPTHRITFTTENRLQGEGGTLEKTRARFDVVSLNKKLYAKLSDLSFTQQSFFDMSAFANKWISVDISEVQKEFIGTDPSMNSELITSEKAIRIKEILLNDDVLSVTNTSKGLFDGKELYTLNFEMTKEQQKQFLIKAYSILFDDLNGEDGQMTEENVNAISDAMQSAPTIQGELWVGKEDFLPYSIVLHLGSSLNSGAFEVTDLSIELVFKNYNVPISVQAPVSAMTFEQVITELFSIPQEATTTPIKQTTPKR